MNYRPTYGKYYMNNSLKKDKLWDKKPVLTWSFQQIYGKAGEHSL